MLILVLYNISICVLITCMLHYVMYIMYEYKVLLPCNLYKKNKSVVFSNIVGKWEIDYVSSQRYPSWKLFSKVLPYNNNNNTCGHRKQKTILLLLPLGQSNTDLFLPLISHFGTSSYKYITWTYRGFYCSRNKSETLHKYNIHEHALDGIDVLDHYGITKVDVIIGHSIGATIAAEMAVYIPNRIDRLVLLNYTPGQVFRWALSPILPSCFRGKSERFIRSMICCFRDKPYIFRFLCRLYRIPLHVILYVLSVFLYNNTNLVKNVYKDSSYLCTLLRHYTDGICSTNIGISQYFETFDQLDKHRVEEHKINTPTLLIGGLWDVFTPVSVYRHSVYCMKNTTYICDIFSTHVSLLENVTHCCVSIEEFISY